MSKKRIQLNAHVTGLQNTLLDSGAFTAWSSGDPIDIGDYTDFVKQYADKLWAYIALDVIPGVKGKTPSKLDIEESARQGWRNYDIMRKEKLAPIPVFHSGERWYWLEKYIAEGAERIALGGVARNHVGHKRHFFDQVFNRLCGSSGYTSVKVHGLGVTSIELMRRYPWASVDSATWLLTPANGSICVPSVANDYTSRPQNVFVVSSETTTSLGSGARRFDRTSPAFQNYVKSCIEDLGMSLDFVRDCYKGRYVCVARYMQRFEKHWKTMPFKQHGLFKHRGIAPSTKQLGDPFTLFLCANESTNCNAYLNYMHAKNRLISYIYFVNKPKANLSHYLDTGYTTPGQEFEEIRHLKIFPKEDWSL